MLLCLSASFIFSFLLYLLLVFLLVNTHFSLFFPCIFSLTTQAIHTYYRPFIIRILFFFPLPPLLVVDILLGVQSRICLSIQTYMFCKRRLFMVLRPNPTAPRISIIITTTPADFSSPLLVSLLPHLSCRHQLVLFLKL